MQPLDLLINNEEKNRRFREVVDQYQRATKFKDLSDLGDRLDYARSTLYTSMSGSRDVADILIYKFCEYFELAPAYFFGRSERLTSLQTGTPEMTDILQIHKLSLELFGISSKLIKYGYSESP